MIDERNFFDEPARNDLRTYDSIRKIVTGPGDDFTTGCSLDYLYFKEYYKLIAIDLSKQQKLDTDPKTIQKVSSAGNLDWAGNRPMVFIIEEAKEKVFNFSKRTVKV